MSRGAAACAIALVMLALPAVAPARTAPPPLGPVDLLSVRDGFVGVTRGVLATSDGGASWRRVLTTRRQVVEVEFPDARNGFALTPRALWTTRDGGASWRRIEPDGGLVSVDFVGPHRGWGIAAAGSRRHGLVRRTVDGGRSWSSLGVRADAVCRASRDAGWLARGRSVERTADGGRTWARVFRAPTTGAPARVSGSVHCPDARRAWALFAGGAAAGSGGYAVWSTADGGRRWQARLAQFLPVPHHVPRIDAYAGPFDVVSAQVVAFLGSCPACANGAGQGTVSLTSTHDGGRSWTHRRVPLPPGPATTAGVMFRGSRSGWVEQTGGAPTAVVATSDGGRRWRRIR